VAVPGSLSAQQVLAFATRDGWFHWFRLADGVGCNAQRTQALLKYLSFRLPHASAKSFLHAVLIEEVDSNSGSDSN
jgi:hypothetical protein